MNNEFRKKEESSFFHRISSFFNKKSSVETPPETRTTSYKSTSNDLQKYMNVNGSTLNTKERALKEFIKKIEDNPDIIENLSNDRLDILISYYENITNSKRIKIERLKGY